MGYMEHRCQCCGELAETVFCQDCTAETHLPAVKEDLRRPLRTRYRTFRRWLSRAPRSVMMPRYETFRNR